MIRADGKSGRTDSKKGRADYINVKDWVKIEEKVWLKTREGLSQNTECRTQKKKKERKKERKKNETDWEWKKSEGLGQNAKGQTQKKQERLSQKTEGPIKTMAGLNWRKVLLRRQNHGRQCEWTHAFFVTR